MTLPKLNELDRDVQLSNTNYFVKKALEIDYSTKKQINVLDIEKQEQLEKLKRDDLLRL